MCSNIYFTSIYAANKDPDFYKNCNVPKKTDVENGFKNLLQSKGFDCIVEILDGQLELRFKDNINIHTEWFDKKIPEIENILNLKFYSLDEEIHNNNMIYTTLKLY